MAPRLRSPPRLLELLLILIGFTHVFISPYTKVEESFNLHAVHDILVYGVGSDGLKNYDHKTFTGPVPRTFIGALLLAWLSYPSAVVANSAGLIRNKADLQVLVRLHLSLFSSLSVIYFTRRLRWFHQVGSSQRPSLKQSRDAGRIADLFLVLVTSQFHIGFWGGRTVPNVLMAFPLAMVATSIILFPKPNSKDVLLGLSVLTSTATIFRLELAALLIPLGFQSVFLFPSKSPRHASFSKSVIACSLSVMAGLVITGTVDKYFWADQWNLSSTSPAIVSLISKYPFLWPEGQGFVFNVLHGKSSEWGTSPWYFYPVMSLPKILSLAYPFALYELAASLLNARSMEGMEGGLKGLGFVVLIQMGLMSLLGHKEWRFLIYGVPIWDLLAVLGWDRVFSSSNIPSTLKKLRYPALIAIVMTSAAFAAVSTILSSYNYSGGDAIDALHRLASTERPEQWNQNLSIHLDTFTLMNGATLFGFINDGRYNSFLTPSPPLSYTWKYDKTESSGLTETDFAQNFDVLLTNDPKKHLWSGNDRQRTTWDVIRVIEGYDGVERTRPKPEVVKTGRLIRRLEIRQLVEDVLGNWMPARIRFGHKVWILRNRVIG